MQSCDELVVPAALEVSRSRQGAHIWMFFASHALARDARRLGTAIISHTCNSSSWAPVTGCFRIRILCQKVDSVTRLRCLCKKGRESRVGVFFVDATLQPYPDQWTFLASVIPMNAHDIESTILRATGNTHSLDVTFINEEDLATPWKPEKSSDTRLNISLPDSLKVTLANLIYFEKAQLPQALANRLIRLAAFQNPEFDKAQAMRMSVWDKPRGCLDTVLSLLHDNSIACEITDERFAGTACDVAFLGKLRPDQDAAVSELLRHDCGVLCTPTAFGKTITAAAAIARQKVNTLVLVHRTELLKQWQERLRLFLQTSNDMV